MKHIFLNLKRFDVPAEMGGVNRLAPLYAWGSTILGQTQDACVTLNEVPNRFPTAPEAAEATATMQKLGCQ